MINGNVPNADLDDLSGLNHRRVCRGKVPQQSLGDILRLQLLLKLGRVFEINNSKRVFVEPNVGATVEMARCNDPDEGEMRVLHRTYATAPPATMATPFFQCSDMWNRK
jgi:hypothetical protein